MLSRIIEWLRRLLAGLGGSEDVDEIRRRAEGEFSPAEEGEEARRYPPEKGFAKAIQNALDNVNHEEWPVGETYRVSVALKADMSVVNPGQIDTYRAVITEP